MTPVRPVSERIRSIAGILALLAALGFLVLTLVDLAQETGDFRRIAMRDAGRAPAPFPERLVSAVRAELADGESWSLNTAAGTCVRDEPMYWLAFRLMPNTADCVEPDVAVYWGVGPPAGSRVARTGRSFVLVRP